MGAVVTAFLRLLRAHVQYCILLVFLGIALEKQRMGGKPFFSFNLSSCHNLPSQEHKNNSSHSTCNLKIYHHIECPPSVSVLFTFIPLTFNSYFHTFLLHSPAQIFRLIPHITSPFGMGGTSKGRVRKTRTPKPISSSSSRPTQPTPRPSMRRGLSRRTRSSASPHTNLDLSAIDGLFNQFKDPDGNVFHSPPEYTPTPSVWIHETSIQCSDRKYCVYLLSDFYLPSLL